MLVTSNEPLYMYLGVTTFFVNDINDVNFWDEIDNFINK